MKSGKDLHFVGSWTDAANFQKCQQRAREARVHRANLRQLDSHFHLLLSRKLHAGHTLTHTIEIPQLKALCSNVCKRHRPDLPRILSFFFFLVPNEVLHENWMYFALVQAYHEEFAWRIGIVCSVIWLSSAFSANMFLKENECPMGVTTKDHNGT